MDKNTEYQIFIGCNDPSTHAALIKDSELQDVVTGFFERNEIDFSMFRSKGGYISDNGSFINEDSLCITIIGADEMDILGFTKSLSMFMNQEHVLVMKHGLETHFQ